MNAELSAEEPGRGPRGRERTYLGGSSPRSGGGWEGASRERRTTLPRNAHTSGLRPRAAGGAGRGPRGSGGGHAREARIPRGSSPPAVGEVGRGPRGSGGRHSRETHIPRGLLPRAAGEAGRGPRGSGGRILERAFRHR